MKRILLFLLICSGFVLAGHAQSPSGDHPVYAGSTTTLSAPESADAVVINPPKFAGQGHGMVSTTYTNENLQNLPTRNINKISGLSMGVECRDGSVPVFKGAVGGTAYFVDGVRVRTDHLCLPGFTGL